MALVRTHYDDILDGNRSPNQILSNRVVFAV